MNGWKKVTSDQGFSHKEKIASGWSAQIKITSNSAGNQVITDLMITADTDQAQDEGLTSAVLRSISLKHLIVTVLREFRDIDIAYLLDEDDKNAKKIKNQWQSEVTGPWHRQGRTSHDISLYAKTAFLYVAELLENPNSPIQTLSVKLNVDRGTLARRIDKARQLGLLTSPVRKGQAAGKPGGALTDKAKELLELTDDGVTK